jgi:NADH dehydrogenase [ubiquinone] 1 alpha subcomplex assembly factor 7
MIEEIRRDGPISTARFMALALSHPRLGYYARHDPLGAAGDFVTAPEISQAFGELVGLWLARAWTDLGRPDPCLLVELGPGRGTLMADLLRAAAQVTGFCASLRLHLVETSARLRDLQRARLGAERVQWHAALDQVPHGPMLLVANEFLDALPVHQLVATGRGWVERLVDVAGGKLTFTLSERPSDLARGLPLSERHLGQTVEVSPLRREVAAAIGRRLAADGGVALLVDYGAWAEVTGDTLQAVRDHAPWPVLASPGEADLSSHVDFRALAEAACAAGAAVYGPVPQGPFLRAMGIDLRIARLLEHATPEQRRQLRAALFRLTDGGAMGELFKVLALAAPGAPPPGFTAPTLAPIHPAAEPVTSRAP